MSKRKKQTSARVKPMTVRELIEELEEHDPRSPVYVWTSGGEYGRPMPTLVIKQGPNERGPLVVLLNAEEDD